MEQVFRHILRLMLAGLLALGAGGVAYAAVPVKTCVFPLGPAVSDAGSLLNQGRAGDCAARQTDLGPGNFGVRLQFDPQQIDPDDPLVLRHSSVWQGAERIVFRYGDGTSSEIAWDSTDASRFLSIGALFEFQVPTRLAPLTGIYIEVRESANWRGVLLGASLLKRSEATRLQGGLIALYAAFAGLTLALLAYNTALWSALRHRFQLWYCAMVGALGLYTFASSGAMLLVFPWIDNNDRLRVNYVMLALAGVAGMRFMLSFFGREIFTPGLRRTVDWFNAATLAWAIAFALLAPWRGNLLDTAYYIVGTGMLALVGPILFQAWKARVNYFWLFVVAWSAPVLATFIRAGHALGLIPYSFWLDNGNLIALSIESLLSTMLIVSRLWDLGRERDAARAGEQTALRLANSDPLTGLLNRRAFLNLAIGRDAAYRLLLIDVDHFKSINDRVGHAAGDDVLRAVAEVIQSCRPQESLAVRLGGEEFALLVPLTRQEECSPGRVLQQIRAHRMPMGLRVTVSLGFADGPVATEEDWKRLYRLADAALYRAKADGRDRACRATDFATIAAA